MHVQTVRFTDSDAGAQFTQSLKETGFAVISSHPISTQLITSTLQEWDDFFAGEKKHQYTFTKEEQAGYFPFKSENAKDAKEKDLKEFFHYYSWGQNPSECPHSSVLFKELTAMATTLLGWIETHSPKEVQALYREPLKNMIIDSRGILLRAIHYPPLTGEEEQGAVRAAAHEDINLITLLPAATEPGLQVRDTQGQWHDVLCDPGTIVINCGDMLSEASGGYFPSTTHQVINPQGEAASKPRFSLPLFLHPRPEVILSDKYTAKEYLEQRLREIGLL